MNNSRLPLDHLNPTSLPASNSSDRARTNAPARFSEFEMQNIRQAFAKRFRIAFRQASNAEIARRIKINPATVKLYVDGDRLPIPEILLQINLITGVNMHWLLTGEGERFVRRERIFSTEEETRIDALAKKSGKNFDEMVNSLTMAMIEAVEKV